MWLYGHWVHIWKDRGITIHVHVCVTYVQIPMRIQCSTMSLVHIHAEDTYTFLFGTHHFFIRINKEYNSGTHDFFVGTRQNFIMTTVFYILYIPIRNVFAGHNNKKIHINRTWMADNISNNKCTSHPHVQLQHARKMLMKSRSWQMYLSPVLKGQISRMFRILRTLPLLKWFDLWQW